MHLLLDTHVFLWLINADTRLPSTLLTQLESADKIFLSSVSVWEVVQKNQRGKLPLPEEAANYLIKQRNLHDIEPLHFHENATRALSQLSPIHRDPFDRMLICQAIEHSLTLVTNDKFIRQYPIKTLW